MSTPNTEPELPPDSQPSAVLSPCSTPLDLDASTSASPSLVGTSSIEAPGPGDKMVSEGKRKQEDGDGDAPSRKKLKLEASEVEEFPLVWPRPGATVAASDNLENNAEIPASHGLDDESAHTGSATPALILPGVLPTPTPRSDSPSSLISLRSLSAPPTSPIITSATQGSRPLPPPASLPPEPEPLHTYACPICFASPTNATLTPCGHIMCGECLFTAVGSAAARMGIVSLAARCPVCRAPIPLWDGRGGGVIGLQPRVVITI
ncbi:hypothetical protein V8E53_009325 [Lactarius tabidus]